MCGCVPTAIIEGRRTGRFGCGGCDINVACVISSQAQVAMAGLLSGGWILVMHLRIIAATSVAPYTLEP